MPNCQSNSIANLALSFPTFKGCNLSRDFQNEEVDVVVPGVPFDLATTISPGTRFGPVAVRQATPTWTGSFAAGPGNLGSPINCASLTAATLGLEFLYVLAANRQEN